MSRRKCKQWNALPDAITVACAGAVPFVCDFCLYTSIVFFTHSDMQFLFYCLFAYNAQRERGLGHPVRFSLENMKVSLVRYMCPAHHHLKVTASLLPFAPRSRACRLSRALPWQRVHLPPARVGFWHVKPAKWCYHTLRAEIPLFQHSLSRAAMWVESRKDETFSRIFLCVFLVTGSTWVRGVWEGRGERVTKGGYRGGGMGDKQSSPFPFNDKWNVIHVCDCFLKMWL